MEFEFIKEALPIERQRKGEYATTIRQWLATENKTLVVRCKNAQEALRVQSGAYAYRRKYNCDFTVFKKDTLTIVLVKA